MRLWEVEMKCPKCKQLQQDLNYEIKTVKALQSAVDALMERLGLITEKWSDCMNTIRSMKKAARKLAAMKPGGGDE